MSVAWRYEDMPRRAGGVSFASSASDVSVSRAGYDLRKTLVPADWSGLGVDVAQGDFAAALGVISAALLGDAKNAGRDADKNARNEKNAKRPWRVLIDGLGDPAWVSPGLALRFARSVAALARENGALAMITVHEDHAPSGTVAAIGASSDLLLRCVPFRGGGGSLPGGACVVCIYIMNIFYCILLPTPLFFFNFFFY